MSKQAILHSHGDDSNICPFGLLPKRFYCNAKATKFEDHKLSSEQKTDKSKSNTKSKTTPQTFIDDQRIVLRTNWRAFLA